MRYFTEEDAKSMPSTDIRIIYFDLLAQYVVYVTEREYLMLGKMSAQQLRQQRPSALKYARSVISEKASKATPISYIREFMGRLALELEQRLDTIKEIADRALELYKADVLTVRGADAMEACWFKYMEAFGEVFDKHSEAITSDPQNNSMMAEIMRSLKEVLAQNDEIKKHTEGVPELVMEAQEKDKGTQKALRHFLNTGAKLTQEEFKMFFDIQDGKTQKQVAEETGKSVGRVRYIAKSMNKKLVKCGYPQQRWNNPGKSDPCK